MKTDQKSSKIDHKIFWFVLVFIKKWKIFWKKILKKFRNKVFQKFFFSSSKTLSSNLGQVVSALKAKKHFLRLTDQPFSMIFWLAPVDREMFSGHLGVFIKKICWGEHLHFNRERPKTSSCGRLGFNGLVGNKNWNLNPECIVCFPYFVISETENRTK